ncbi:MAG: Carbamoyltransferase [Acidobacteria bacterium]|nr:Carbamoyltransferase [Acidobacteriota bacterium]
MKGNARPTRILGISAYYHDSAAALVVDGEVVAAAQEERFTRKKGDAGFPHHAIAACLERGGIDLAEVDFVAFYENPMVKFERLFISHAVTAPHSLRSFLRAFPSWLTGKLWQESGIASELGVKKRVHVCDHHLSHAASAFFPSPFESAAVLTIDGVGEWSTATWGVGRGNGLELQKQIRFPDSLGLLYSAFTHYTGFRINSGEYKLMGLAPYGRPLYTQRIRDHIVHVRDDGSIVLNQRYFDYVGGLRMTNARFHELFGGPPREPETELTQKEMDIAASIQEVLNDAVMKMARHVHAATGERNLVMAGGVALNVVANGLLSMEGPFEQIWIQPAAGDAGGSLGAALWLWHQVLGKERLVRKPDSMRGAMVGNTIPPAANADDDLLLRLGASWDLPEEDELQRRIAKDVADGKVVGVARGAMEFGPRALGARSILADARSSAMQRHMNLKIKFRESFRPFAAIVLAEDADQYFDIRQESPYMLLVYPVREERRIAESDEHRSLFGIDRLNQTRSDIPAVTHVDYSCRVQTVDNIRNPFLHGVLSEFKTLTGASLMVNTSFNVRGEPIVSTSEDAYRCFMATDIDVLVVGNRYLRREDQARRPMDDSERESWLKRFDLD